MLTKLQLKSYLDSLAAPSMTWSDKADFVIREVVSANRDKPVDEVVKAIRLSYPFGARVNHPYKVWCKRIKRAEQELRRQPQINQRQKTIAESNRSPGQLALEVTT